MNKCRQCGRQFNKLGKWHIYCSMECLESSLKHPRRPDREKEDWKPEVIEYLKAKGRM